MRAQYFFPNIKHNTMKTLILNLMALSTITLFACNANNADNPSNSAESSDTTLESTVDLNDSVYNGTVTTPVSDSTTLMDTLPKK